MSTVTRSRPFRAIALCLSDAPVCPKCGRTFMDTQIPPDGKVMRYCHRKRMGRPCGGRAYIVGLDNEMCAVIAITEAQWDEAKSRRAVPFFREIGALVEAVSAAHTQDSR